MYQLDPQVFPTSTISIHPPRQINNSQVHDIEHDSPGLHVDPSCLNEVVVDTMEEQAERLDNDQNTHQVVDLEDGIPAEKRRCLKTRR